MKRLSIYGDSIMRGVTFCEQKGRHTLCRGHKLDKLSELGFDIKNRSRMGATIDYGLDILDKTTDEFDEKTLVLFEYGGNDCDYDWKSISDNPLGTFSPKTPEKIFAEHYGCAIKKAKELGAFPILSTLIPIDSEKYLKFITKNNSYENILMWLGDSSMLYRWQERYNRIVESVAREYGCPLFDIREKFLLSHSYRDLMCSDGIHPSDKGHDLIEDELCKFVKNTVKAYA